MLNVAASNLT